MSPTVIKILTAIGLLTLLVLGSYIDSEEVDASQAQYCEMVGAHMKDKDHGWPDFNGNYKEVCLEKKQ